MQQIIRIVKTQKSIQNYTTPDVTKSMVESAGADDMGQFRYHLDPDIRKITKILENCNQK